MTEAQTALGRRAVACKGWRWLRGMLRQDDYRYIGSGVWARWSDVHSLTTALHAPGQLPDLTDPATLGCLLALVREAWRCPTAHVRQSRVRRVSDGLLAWEGVDLWLDAEACKKLGTSHEGSVGCWGYASEAEALVFLLETAP
jgi:hypothetical protein